MNPILGKEQSSIRKRNGPTMRVLLVEDDATAARAIELMLRSDSHDCDTVSLGEEAVRLALQNDYDIILLDIMLPDIDGYDVLHRLRECDVQAPVLFQSGLVTSERDRAALGVSESLLKPFDKQELNASVAAMMGAPELDGQRSASEAANSNQERRHAPRAKSFKPAVIVYDNGKCTLDCTVLNLSEGGAAILPTDITNIPDCFTLRIRFGPTHECEVRWRRGNKLGVRFLND
jgi:DNA-binding response OmpR family regulator